MEKRDATIFSQLSRVMNVTGDKGGRDIIKASDTIMYVDFCDTMAGFDIDTLEDYYKCLKKI